MEYRRVYVKGGTYFFTLVTYHCKRILSSLSSIKLLEDGLRYANDRMPFDIVASVILPDHAHFIWTLPEQSADFSTRWRLTKSYFSRNYSIGESQCVTKSRLKKGERDVWQRRFWEHLIRDENDLRRHIEYIHYNPVKHGYTASPAEWIYSSFKRYVQDGLYSMNWGSESLESKGYQGIE